MSLFFAKEQESISNFVSQYDMVKNRPVLTDILDVNNVQEGKCYLGSPSKFIKVLKDYKEKVYVFLLIDNGKEDYLDVISFDEFERFIPTGS